MYYYIVDPQKLSQKDFERVQNVLYSSLSEFRISGEVVRVTGLRTIHQLVENAFTHEARTIVAVGSDETLHEVINAVGLREMTIGFIPITDSAYGNIFGLKDVLQGVKTIAARRIEELDLGIVNGNYFLSKLVFESLQPIELEFSADNNFKAQVQTARFEIINCSEEGEKVTDATDGRLDISFSSEKLSVWQKFLRKTTQSSILHVQKIEINTPGLALKLGDKVLAKTPALIDIIPKALKIIVGRDRNL